MIGKFSNTCVISTPSFESLQNFDANVRTGAITVMENVLLRLMNQGVTNYALLADTSLNLEVCNILNKHSNADSEPTSDVNGHPISIELYDAIPPSLRKFWLDNFAPKGRLDLIFNLNTKRLDLLSLLDLDGEIYKILNTGMDTKSNEIKNESKFKIVRSVYTLVTLNKPINDESLKGSRHQFQDALFLMGMTAQQFKDSIMSDIDSHYAEASRYILESSQEAKRKMMYNRQEQSEPSETRKGIMGAIAMMKAKSARVAEEKGSRMEFQYNNDAFEVHADDELTDEDLKATNIAFSLSESFDSDEHMYSAFIQGGKVEELTALEKLSDKYAVEILKFLASTNNLLINFYLQTTDQKYKTLAQQEGNKFCLNVDLKTGAVDLTLKSQTFKLNPFFPNNEEVKVNAYEW